MKRKVNSISTTAATIAADKHHLQGQDHDHADKQTPKRARAQQRHSSSNKIKRDQNADDAQWLASTRGNNGSGATVQLDPDAIDTDSEKEDEDTDDHQSSRERDHHSRDYRNDSIIDISACNQDDHTDGKRPISVS